MLLINEPYYFALLPVPVALPVLPALGTDEPGVLGEVVVLDGELVLAPEPALLRSSRRQSSRAVPVRPTHFAGVLAPAPAVSVVVLPPGLVEVRLSALLPLVPPTLEPDAEPAAPEAPEPVPEPDDCANAAEERASSAAAVAAVSVFNIMVLCLRRVA